MLPYIRGRKGGILAVDLGLAAIAQLLLVYVLLRFRNPDDIIEIVSFSILVAAPALFLVQAHSQVWHRVSMPDLIALVQAAGIVATAVGIASLMRFANDTSIRLLIGTLIILTAAWSGPRVLTRLSPRQVAATPGNHSGHQQPHTQDGFQVRTIMPAPLILCLFRCQLRPSPIRPPAFC